jgi:hypothetical protein
MMKAESEFETVPLQGLLDLARFLRAKNPTARIWADTHTVEGFRMWFRRG